MKVVAKSLGEKYYKKKGYVKELVDDYVGLVVMNDTGKLSFNKNAKVMVDDYVGLIVMNDTGKFSL